MDLDRRSFLKGLLGAAALAYVPRTTYVFLSDNPLADDAFEVVHRPYFSYVSVDRVLKDAYAPMVLELLDRDALDFSTLDLPVAGKVDRPRAQLEREPFKLEWDDRDGPILLGHPKRVFRPRT